MSLELFLFKLFYETEVLHYFYIFLSLLGVFIIVTRKMMTLEDEIGQYTRKHPERTEKMSSYSRLRAMQITFGILLVLVTVAGMFRMGVDTSPSGKEVAQQYIDSFEWDSKPVQKSFVTRGKFKDGSPIEIEYNLIVQFPKNDKRMDYLQSTFGTPERLFGYLKTYLVLITRMTTASTQEVSASFWESLRRQSIHGLEGISPADIGKSPKNYGIQITVSSIEKK